MCTHVLHGSLEPTGDVLHLHGVVHACGQRVHACLVHACSPNADYFEVRVEFWMMYFGHFHLRAYCVRTGMPRASRAVSREKPNGTPGSPPNATVLQQHCMFWDQDGDGLIYPWCALLLSFVSGPSVREAACHVQLASVKLAPELLHMKGPYCACNTCFWPAVDMWICPELHSLLYVSARSSCMCCS